MSARRADDIASLLFSTFFIQVQNTLLLFHTSFLQLLPVCPRCSLTFPMYATGRKSRAARIADVLSASIYRNSGRIPAGLWGCSSFCHPANTALIIQLKKSGLNLPSNPPITPDTKQARQNTRLISSISLSAINSRSRNPTSFSPSLI